MSDRVSKIQPPGNRTWSRSRAGARTPPEERQPQTDQTKDERGYTRIDLSIRLTATVEGRSKSVQGEVDNISLSGVFVMTAETLPLDEPVVVQLTPLSAAAPPPPQVKGVVVRVEEEGIGVQFRGLDLDSFQDLVAWLVKWTPEGAHLRAPIKV